MMPIGNPMIFRHYPLEAALELMAQFGYRSLEIWPAQIEMCRTVKLRGEFVQLASALGLKLVRLNAAAADYFVPLQKPRDARQIVAGLKKDIDLAKSLGMTELLTWEGRRPEGARARDVHGWLLRETIGIFREAVSYGQSRGISVSVEVHPYTLGIDVEFLKKLCDGVASDSFGVTYDCCHFGVGLPDSYIKAIGELGPRIKHVHFSDSDKISSELHFAIGKGCLDLAGITKALKAIRYRGSMMLDLWLYPFPEAGTRVSLPYVRQVMKKLNLKQR
ncbi:MAG TPA: sugar phosphate isomerase/epimerase family protein [Verrucomicrobiae bacterium]|jgi:sugar phosphate isomerase/epimerase|nr:sugar phosphate isomerase/epimerase family protein [Verrucomicrobiae bacterium]